ncbi:MAG: bifunctional helix-turn-helix domain-containing protein/methylated-DNA--[protein]-cysteine S-methyltransferase [Rhodobiaceae bacterium]|nr:bifunctional helix-turn-helix domain-containing protein/methylated-DNA--[protein]-cysteine S-methyltransferase [Rhodobiaceae bacterium]
MRDATDTMTQPQPLSTDYRLVSKAIEYLDRNWRDQPGLDELAHELGQSPTHVQKVFTRWAGISPKAFVQAITIDAARKLLRESASVLDTAYEVGLSGPGRLHDLFVTHDAMSPGEYKARGAGVEIVWGWHASPFGKALLMATDRGLAGLAFADEGREDATFEDMASRWPAASFRHDDRAVSAYAARIFDPDEWRPDRPLRVVFIGSGFEVKVWETLLRIPFGRATTYSDIASHIGNPNAARAVGAAVGRNPISFIVPCHRVLGKSGGLCGYHWGLTRKKAILGWEAGLVAGN